jgi:hypothetical protein
MTLHSSTFNYYSPTAEQLEHMKLARGGFARLADMLDDLLPEGPDKTYIMRSLRTVAMWANVTITRQADGSPRDGGQEPDYPAGHPAPGDLGSTPL